MVELTGVFMFLSCLYFLEFCHRHALSTISGRVQELAQGLVTCCVGEGTAFSQKPPECYVPGKPVETLRGVGGLWEGAEEVEECKGGQQ